MGYSLEKLTSDVMARLGEIPRPQQSLSGAGCAGIPWPQDMISLKVCSLLPEVGGRLIREAGVGLSGRDGFEAEGFEVRKVLMPCGLYAAEVPLPDDFLRLGSVKMGEWRMGVGSLTLPADPDSGRQWSSEPGIAGGPTRPRAYLDSGSEGLLLRLMGSERREDVLEWLGLWRIPAADEEGSFRFPAVLYPELVSALAGRLSE